MENYIHSNTNQLVRKRPNTTSAEDSNPKRRRLNPPDRNQEINNLYHISRGQRHECFLREIHRALGGTDIDAVSSHPDGSLLDLIGGTKQLWVNRESLAHLLGLAHEALAPLVTTERCGWIPPPMPPGIFQKVITVGVSYTSYLASEVAVGACGGCDIAKGVPPTRRCHRGCLLDFVGAVTQGMEEGGSDDDLYRIGMLVKQSLESP
jgi:hypothetical protein